MIRKNKKFIDPRYFMDEKMELREGLALDQQYKQPISQIAGGIILDGRPGNATIDFSFPYIKVGDKRMTLGQQTDDHTTQWIFKQFLPLVKDINTKYPLKALDVDALVASQGSFGDTAVNFEARGAPVWNITKLAGLEPSEEIVLNNKNFWPFMVAAAKWAKGAEYEGGQGQ